MSTAPKRRYEEALAAAEALAGRLEASCARLLIAGSLRRQKAEIGDIELVAIPAAAAPERDLFGQAIPGTGESPLDRALATLNVTFTKNGPRYKQFTWSGMPVDLFLATPETWGSIATIRTGSADFTHWLVTAKRHGGACPSGMQFKEGRLRFAGQMLSTPEERDIFDALGVAWVEPLQRIEGRWQR